MSKQHTVGIAISAICLTLLNSSAAMATSIAADSSNPGDDRGSSNTDAKINIAVSAGFLAVIVLGVCLKNGNAIYNACSTGMNSINRCYRGFVGGEETQPLTNNNINDNSPRSACCP